MSNLLKYKDFIGSVDYSSEDNVFFGKLEGVTDLVTFEGDSVKSLKQSFHEAVDDYIEICHSSGKDPYKSFKGSFNVRIQPDLHRRAALKSIEMGVSLNQLVAAALDRFVKTKRKEAV